MAFEYHQKPSRIYSENWEKIFGKKEVDYDDPEFLRRVAKSMEARIPDEKIEWPPMRSSNYIPSGMVIMAGANDSTVVIKDGQAYDVTDVVKKIKSEGGGSSAK